MNGIAECFVTEAEFGRVIDPAKMVKPQVAAANGPTGVTPMTTPSHPQTNLMSFLSVRGS